MRHPGMGWHPDPVWDRRPRPGISDRVASSPNSLYALYCLHDVGACSNGSACRPAPRIARRARERCSAAFPRLAYREKPTVADLISQSQFGWAQALLQEEGQDQEVQDGTSVSVRTDTMVFDVAPDHTAFLCLVDSLMRLGPLRSFEANGKAVEYWPANARPKAFDQGASGQYSPDGGFVMVNFRYDDDGHKFWSYDKDGQIKGMPGTVQIFTREGEFQTEVFVHAYRENLPVSYAQAYWLRDDWIVYTLPYDLVFVKVLYK